MSIATGPAEKNHKPNLVAAGEPREYDWPLIHSLQATPVSLSAQFSRRPLEESEAQNILHLESIWPKIAPEPGGITANTVPGLRKSFVFLEESRFISRQEFSFRLALSHQAPALLSGQVLELPVTSCTSRT
jgi:hypothetical protein